jgi:uncharacterized membrane protein YdbT with pleckstrin-like domain
MKAKKEFLFPAFLILPKEKVIFRVHPHWLYVLVPELIIIISGILFLRYGYSFLIEFADWILFIFGGIFAFAMIIIFLEWICINYYLTNLRLIEERGIIGKRIVSIWLDKVQDITCKYGIAGRIFNFGDIEIQSAGTLGKIVFNFLPSPRKLQEKIEKAILDYKKEK